MNYWDKEWLTDGDLIHVDSKPMTVLFVWWEKYWIEHDKYVESKWWDIEETFVEEFEKETKNKFYFVI